MYLILLFKDKSVIVNSLYSLLEQNETTLSAALTDFVKDDEETKCH